MDSLTSRTSPSPGDRPSSVEGTEKAKATAKVSGKNSPALVGAIGKQVPPVSEQSSPSATSKHIAADVSSSATAQPQQPEPLNMQVYIPGICHDRGLEAIASEVCKLEKRANEVKDPDLLPLLPLEEKQRQMTDVMAIWIESFQLMRKYCKYLDTYPDERQWLAKPTLETPSQQQYLHMHLEIAMVLDRRVSQLPHSHFFNQFIVGAFVLQGTGAPLSANAASQTDVGQAVLGSSLEEYLGCLLSLSHLTRSISASLPKEARDKRQGYHNENIGVTLSFFAQCFSHLKQRGGLERFRPALTQLFSEEWCKNLLAEVDYDTLTNLLKKDSDDNIAQRCVHLSARLQLIAEFEPLERAIPLLYWINNNQQHFSADGREQITDACCRMIARYIAEVRRQLHPDHGVPVIKAIVRLSEAADWGVKLNGAIQLLKNKLPAYKKKTTEDVLRKPKKPLFLSEPVEGRYWKPEAAPYPTQHPDPSSVIACQRNALSRTREWQVTKHIDQDKAQSYVKKQDFSQLQGLSQKAWALSAQICHQSKGKRQPAAETMAQLFKEGAPHAGARRKKPKSTWRQQAFELNCQYQMYLDENPAERWVLQLGTYRQFQYVLEMHKHLQDFCRHYAFGVTTQRDEMTKACVQYQQAYCVGKEEKAKAEMLHIIESLLDAYFSQAVVSFYLATSLRKKGEGVEVKEVMPLLREVSKSCLEGLSEAVNLLEAIKENKPRSSEKTADGESCTARWNNLWTSVIEKVKSTPLYNSRDIALRYEMPTYARQPEAELAKWHRVNEGRLLTAFLLEQWCEGEPERVLERLDEVRPAFDREDIRSHVFSVFRECMQLCVKSAVALNKEGSSEAVQRKSVATLQAISHSLNYGWLGKYWFVWTSFNARQHGKAVTRSNNLYSLIGKELPKLREVEATLQAQDAKAKDEQDTAHAFAIKDIETMRPAPRKIKQQAAPSFTPRTSDAWKPANPKCPEPVEELSPLEKVFKPVDDMVAGNPRAAMEKVKALIKKYSGSKTGEQGHEEYVHRGQLTKADAAIVLLRRALHPLSGMKKDCVAYREALEQAIATPPHQYPPHDQYERVMKHIHTASLLLPSLDGHLMSCTEALQKVAELPPNFSKDIDSGVVLMVRKDCGDIKTEVDTVMGVAASLKRIIELRGQLFELNPPAKPLSEEAKAQGKENRAAINKTSSTLTKVEGKVTSLLGAVNRVVQENAVLEELSHFDAEAGL
ncbi:hypothetical protein [Sansalvadorimonas verongulae]|uniref:hypothetical protein n=1 Tax=Sansalvadorimonas verongulae TaxID=2172824 RepID=UPI0012BB51FF|nr:hypothetical protein [Sansalvadorimonas verongulae]MTI15151.1 hypothetical protein [Sansalvadorimonas verongulae]